MFSRVVELAGKTRALAENALEALDAPDDRERDQSFERRLSGSFSARDSPVPQLVENEYQHLLSQVVAAVTNQTSSNVDLRECAQVVVTQIMMLRENASSSSSLDSSLRECISGGSLIEIVDRLIETGGMSEMTNSLLDALDSEQQESGRLRSRISELLKKGGVGPNSETSSEESSPVLRQRIEELEMERERVSVEVQKLHLQIAKVVKEKTDLEVERDNEDKIDARVMRSAFMTLSAQIDNKPVRDGVLRVIAEMLELSPEDRTSARIPEAGDVSSSREGPGGLATEFLRFLQEEVATSSQQLDNSFSEI